MCVFVRRCVCEGEGGGALPGATVTAASDAEIGLSSFRGSFLRPRVPRPARNIVFLSSPPRGREADRRRLASR